MFDQHVDQHICQSKGALKVDGHFEIQNGRRLNY